MPPAIIIIIIIRAAGGLEGVPRLRMMEPSPVQGGRVGAWNNHCAALPFVNKGHHHHHHHHLDRFRAAGGLEGEPPPPLWQIRLSTGPSGCKGAPKASSLLAKMGRSLPPAWAKGLLLLTLRVSVASVMQTVSLVDSCRKTLHGDGMVLTSHSESRRYYFVAAGTDCQLTMQAASPQDKVRFQFRFFLVYNMLRSPSATPPGTTVDLHAPASAQETAGPCATGSYLQFHDGRDHTARPLRGPLCGKTIPRPLLSSGRFLTLRLVTRGHHPRVDFVGDFTSLRTGLNASACRAESYFPCRNGHCIPRSLVCDGRTVDNCGNGTDQAVQPLAWCEGPPTPVSVLPSEAVGVRPKPVTCEERQETPRQPPGVSPWDQADKCRMFLASLAALSGAVLLFWCCWNPGWLLWRVGACRHLPGCNSACAACHLCTRSCTHRAVTATAAQVTPRGIAEAPL